MAMVMSERPSQTPTRRNVAFHPSVPVRRSIIRSRSHFAESAEPLSSATTIFPSVLGRVGAAQTRAPRSTLHFCVPSAAE